MIPSIRISCVAFALLATWSCSVALAQLPSGGVAGRPTFSPYLNLLRRSDPVLNYYGIVRPEQDFRAANQAFRGSLQDMDRRFEEEGNQSLRSRLQSSGHAVRFFSDLRGGPGSVGQAVSNRSTGLGRREQSPSQLGTTGHSAYFGNRGSYFPDQQTRRR
ncbi:MAG: hypothetical protein O3A00_12065 [Planctomycetota bacterium]|nr:hypothetical protein [Planctomycetota bacterium]